MLEVDVDETSLSSPRQVVAPASGLGLYGVTDTGNLFLRRRGDPWQAQPLRLLVNWQRRASQAGVKQDIGPFATFLGTLVGETMQGKPVPKVPPARG